MTVITFNLNIELKKMHLYNIFIMRNVTKKSPKWVMDNHYSKYIQLQLLERFMSALITAKVPRIDVQP